MMLRCRSLLLAPLLALAWLAGAAAQEGRDDAPRVAAEVLAPLPDARALAVRIRDEDEGVALRLAALANEEIARHGFRVDAMAPVVLYLRFERPRTLRGRDQPAVTLEGRGGSETRGEFGLAIELPPGNETAEPPPTAAHRLLAELETAPGTVAWRAEAVVEAVPGPEMEPRLVRSLAASVARALARDLPKGGR